MDGPAAARSSRWALAGVLTLAVLTRLYQFQGPMADSLQAKQVYVANKARSIARAPFNPMRNSLDFLDNNGERLILTEEIPLYTALLGLGYRIFGERDEVGHALSLLGSLLAILALYDLAKREQGQHVALVSALIFTSAPLFVFYGRAVLADPWMLAGMLGSAACYRRFLDGQGNRWLAASAFSGLLAVAFKYFALMVLIVLADMTRRSGGWRACLKAPLVLLTLAMIVPTTLWMALVFARSPNPVASGWSSGQEVYPYLIVQAPRVLLDRNFYSGLLSRFPLRDFGPVASALAIIGIVAIARKRLNPGPIGAWTLMGVLFYVLLGPKLIDHDYYELMLLPAASLWAGWGVVALAGWGSATAPAWRPRLAVGTLVALVAVQGPWVLGDLFRLDAAKVALANRIRQESRPEDRVLVIGPGTALVTVVHYSQREGWAERCLTLPDDWQQRIQHCRARGASLVAVYLDPKHAQARSSFEPLFQAFPQVEHARKPANRERGTAEFVLLRLDRHKPPRMATQTPTSHPR